jgi:hypothetical protein
MDKQGNHRPINVHYNRKEKRVATNVAAILHKRAKMVADTNVVVTLHKEEKKAAVSIVAIIPRKGAKIAVVFSVVTTLHKEEAKKAAVSNVVATPRKEEIAAVFSVVAIPRKKGKKAAVISAVTTICRANKAADTSNEGIIRAIGDTVRADNAEVIRGVINSRGVISNKENIIPTVNVREDIIREDTNNGDLIILAPVAGQADTSNEGIIRAADTTKADIIKEIDITRARAADTNAVPRAVINNENRQSSADSNRSPQDADRLSHSSQNQLSIRKL